MMRFKKADCGAEVPASVKAGGKTSHEEVRMKKSVQPDIAQIKLLESLMPSGLLPVYFSTVQLGGKFPGVMQSLVH